MCVQGGGTVESVTHAGFPAGRYYGWPFQRGPASLWTSGAACCTLAVTHPSKDGIVKDAQTGIHVSG